MNYRKMITMAGMPFIDVVNAYLDSLPVTANATTLEQIPDHALIIQTFPKKINLYNKNLKLLSSFGKDKNYTDVMQLVKKLQSEGKISQDLRIFHTTREDIPNAPLTDMTYIFKPS